MWSSGKQHCPNCNRTFESAQCFANHIAQTGLSNKTTRNTLRRFRTCNKVYNRFKSKGRHSCGESCCSVCPRHRPAGHLCFIKQAKNTSRPENEKFIYIFFDFECTQNTPSPSNPDAFVHTPNFCAAQQVCYRCVSESDMERGCAQCGVRQHVFSGAETLEHFMAYLTQPRMSFSRIILIAHNMKARPMMVSSS